MDSSSVINMFLGVLLVVVVILLLQYMSPFYVFGVLFFISVLLYIITFNKSQALLWLVVFMAAFFVIQYIHFNQNIVLTVSPTTTTASTATTATAASTTTTSTSVPAGVPPKTVWYLAFQSD
jgi:hypothetical protein